MMVVCVCKGKEMPPPPAKVTEEGGCETLGAQGGWLSEWLVGGGVGRRCAATEVGVGWRRGAVVWVMAALEAKRVVGRVDRGGDRWTPFDGEGKEGEAGHKEDKEGRRGGIRVFSKIIS